MYIPPQRRSSQVCGLSTSFRESAEQNCPIVLAIQGGFHSHGGGNPKNAGWFRKIPIWNGWWKSGYPYDTTETPEGAGSFLPPGDLPAGSPGPYPSAGITDAPWCVARATPRRNRCNCQRRLWSKIRGARDDFGWNAIVDIAEIFLAYTRWYKGEHSCNDICSEWCCHF